MSNFTTLKGIKTISFLAFILLFSLGAFANTEEKKGKELKEFALDPSKTISDDNPISSDDEVAKQDTTEVNSVSKFNFVFYYIYKMKYTEDKDGNEKVDYTF